MYAGEDGSIKRNDGMRGNKEWQLVILDVQVAFFDRSILLVSSASAHSSALFLSSPPPLLPASPSHSVLDLRLRLLFLSLFSSLFWKWEWKGWRDARGANDAQLHTWLTSARAPPGVWW